MIALEFVTQDGTPPQLIGALQKGYSITSAAMARTQDRQPWGCETKFANCPQNENLPNSAKMRLTLYAKRWCFVTFSVIFLLPV